jgi:hypothetical protein
VKQLGAGTSLIPLLRSFKALAENPLQGRDEPHVSGV